MGPVTLLYDEDCGFCRWSADLLRAWDREHRLRFLPIQAPGGQALLSAVPAAARLDSVHVVTPDGRLWSAGAAIAPVFSLLPGGRPLAAIARAVPGATERVYRAVARRRSRLGRLLGTAACSVDPSGSPT